jgi:hypothetical protein
MKPQIYRTNKVTAKISEDRSLEVEVGNTKIQISDDGDYIKIYKSNEIMIFFYEEMPK